MDWLYREEDLEYCRMLLHFGSLTHSAGEVEEKATVTFGLVE